MINQTIYILGPLPGEEIYHLSYRYATNEKELIGLVKERVNPKRYRNCWTRINYDIDYQYGYIKYEESDTEGVYCNRYKFSFFTANRFKKEGK
jgi:hypothetical protein